MHKTVYRVSVKTWQFVTLSLNFNIGLSTAAASLAILSLLPLYCHYEQFLKFKTILFSFTNVTSALEVFLNFLKQYTLYKSPTPTLSATVHFVTGRRSDGQADRRQWQ